MAVIYFLIGIFGGAFLMLVILQLVNRKAITFAGYKDKSENTKRYWNLTLCYLAGAICMAALFLNVYLQ